MDIARIVLTYKNIDKMTQAHLDELTAAIFRHPIFQNEDMKLEAKPHETEEGFFRLDYWHRDLIVDLDKIFTIPVELVARLRVSKALEAATEPRLPAFNERVDVAVPSNALLDIKHVQVHNDYCTESLQERLDQGWKILAICPQPDQRRPDYVMGKL